MSCRTSCVSETPADGARKARLFVYGTLAPGRPNEHVLGVLEGRWEPATVRGRLERRGWGAEMGYPALVLDRAGDEVRGFVFSSSRLVDHWDELDRFEGDEYRRVLTKVRTESGCWTKACVYVLREH